MLKSKLELCGLSIFPAKLLFRPSHPFRRPKRVLDDAVRCPLGDHSVFYLFILMPNYVRNRIGESPLFPQGSFLKSSRFRMLFKPNLRWGERCVPVSLQLERGEGNRKDGEENGPGKPRNPDGPGRFEVKMKRDQEARARENDALQKIWNPSSANGLLHLHGGGLELDRVRPNPGVRRAGRTPFESPA